jgi:hypothetical protein
LGGAVTALAFARPQAMRIDTQRVEIEALEARLGTARCPPFETLATYKKCHATMLIGGCHGAERCLFGPRSVSSALTHWPRVFPTRLTLSHA